MGHSYGGGIVQAMAAVVPERVIRVVAIEALGLLTSVRKAMENITEREREKLEEREKMREREREREVWCEVWGAESRECGRKGRRRRVKM
eukprot:953430-Rhodomonas_salina.2